jgi:hypothetical protein
MGKCALHGLRNWIAVCFGRSQESDGWYALPKHLLYISALNVYFYHGKMLYTFLTILVLQVFRISRPRPLVQHHLGRAP